MRRLCQDFGGRADMRAGTHNCLLLPSYEHAFGEFLDHEFYRLGIAKRVVPRKRNSAKGAGISALLPIVRHMQQVMSSALSQP
jgi:hypothetical protein